jgi:hypothetical protein
MENMMKEFTDSLMKIDTPTNPLDRQTLDRQTLDRQTLDRQTLDTTNPGHDKPWTRQPLDRIEQGACTLGNVN